VRGISIISRFNCGRVRECRVATTHGTYTFGGDKIRFAFRRDAPGNPIMRSAHFTVQSVARGAITLNGQGNGHGVGMCQRGALGRARAGQTYQQILQAYYRGITIEKITPR
jgi:stage II sporulation protein D